MRKLNADVKVFKAMFLSLVLAMIIYACAIVVHSEGNPVKSRDFNLNLNKMDASKQTESLVEFTQVEKTPFTVAKVYNDEAQADHYFVLFGKYRMNEDPFLVKEDAIESAETITWDSIMKLIFVLQENQSEINKVLDDE